MRMPFGKHAGVELTEVPKQYLRWLRSQQWVGGWLLKEVNDVLNGKVVAPSDESIEEALSKWKESENQHDKQGVSPDGQRAIPTSEANH